MILGLCLFVLVFILLAPASRAMLAASANGFAAWLISWAPFSFILLAIMIAMPIVAVYLIKTWPVHVEPENPMAKYRRGAMDDGD
jgi:predicted membrane protein